MRLSQIGEFGLIRRLVRDITLRADVAVPAGDDAAVLTPAVGQQLVATIDAQVEGKHFVRSVAGGYDIGYKALAVNLSDLAAMGATPAWALISLLVPLDTPVSLLDDMYRGMNEIAREFQVSIVGGNVSSIDGPLAVDVALLGQVASGHALLRRGAAPGDVVLVTGALGAAAAGVLSLRDAATSALDAGLVETARAAMLRPRPLVREGQALARSGLVTAMLDVSDGLAADLGHLCEASHVGAVVDVETIPVHEAARAIAPANGLDPLALALSGGEDYQLLFTVRREHLSDLRIALGENGADIAEIGTITGDVGRLMLRASDGSLAPLEVTGWDHLRMAGPDQSES